MKKGMYFFMGLSFTLFWIELYLASNEKGHWGFVWVNVFIFFLALLVLAGEYADKNRGKKAPRKPNNLSGETASVQKPFWGDSRKT